MTIVQDYRTYLLTESTVTDQVGTRIYFRKLPQRAQLPSIVLSLITTVSQDELEDASGFARTRIQVDSYSNDYTDAQALAEIVRKVTEQYSGAMGSTEIDRGLIDSTYEVDEGPNDGSDTTRFVRSLDVILWHDEPLPTT